MSALWVKAVKLGRTLAALARYRQLRRAPPVYLDIGARGGLPNSWEVAYRLGFIRPVFVEPDAKAASALSDKYAGCRVLTTALGSRTGEHATLHVTHEPGRSSILRPASEEPYVASDPDPWRIIAEEPVVLSRMDEAWNETWGSPTLVKADVQGYEIEILKGMGSLLDRVDCLELEVSLVAFYEGQPLLADVYQFLRERKFHLVRLKPNGLSLGTNVAEFNAFFVRQGRHDRLPVKMWKALNDVGDHRRAITWGY